MASRRAYADEYAVRVNRAVELLADSLAGGRGARAADRACAVGASGAPVCERGAGDAGRCGGAGAHGGVHGPAGAVVDRRAAPAARASRGQTLSATVAEAVRLYLDQAHERHGGKAR